jgi:hypothetical protein
MVRYGKHTINDYNDSGQRVILASDLAALYGVQIKALNQAVKRNKDRFPDDFVFQLTGEEAENILRSRSQIVTFKRGSRFFQLKNVHYLHAVISLCKLTARLKVQCDKAAKLDKPSLRESEKDGYE